MFEAGEWAVPITPPVRQDPEQTPPADEATLTAQSILSLAFLEEKMREVFDEHAEDIIQQGFETAVERLGADTNFVPEDPTVQSAISRLNRQARGIGQTTQQQMNESIAKGIAENEGVEDIQGRVVQTLEKMADGDRDPDTDISESRARRIASTTTTTAFESGQQSAFQQTSMFGKMWLSQRDTEVRSGHLDADGQTVNVSEPFRVAPSLGGSEEELRFPGDPTGRPSNVINCRCTSLPVPDEPTFNELQEEEPDLSNLPQLDDE